MQTFFYILESMLYSLTFHYIRSTYIEPLFAMSRWFLTKNVHFLFFWMKSISFWSLDPSVINENTAWGWVYRLRTKLYMSVYRCLSLRPYSTYLFTLPANSSLVFDSDAELMDILWEWISFKLGFDVKRKNTINQIPESQYKWSLSDFWIT